MGLFGNKRPWYVTGLAFQCTGCGNCCAGPEEGYVWVNEQQIKQIATFLGISEAQMRQRYVREVGNKCSLIERSDSRDCIFLAARAPSGRTCDIYPVRPQQCRTWPFWIHNLRTQQDWILAGIRCPGINSGPLFGADEIDQTLKSPVE